MKIPRHIFEQFARAVAVAHIAERGLDPAKFGPAPAFIVMPLQAGDVRARHAIETATGPDPRKLEQCIFVEPDEGERQW